MPGFCPRKHLLVCLALCFQLCVYVWVSACEFKFLNGPEALHLLELELQAVVRPGCGHWVLISGPLQEQQILSVTESAPCTVCSLQISLPSTAVRTIQVLTVSALVCNLTKPPADHFQSVLSIETISKLGFSLITTNNGCTML